MTVGHSVEFGWEHPDNEFVVFDGTKIYIRAVIMIESGLGLVQFHTEIFTDFTPSSRLVLEVAYTTKNMNSVSLVQKSDGNSDLLVCGDQVITADPDLDAEIMASYLRAIHELSQELKLEWSNI